MYLGEFNSSPVIKRNRFRIQRLYVSTNGECTILPANPSTLAYKLTFKMFSKCQWTKITMT